MPNASPPTDPPRRVALYGGSFNPPHLAHVMVATFALTTERFDEIRLMPARGHAFGKALAPFSARCELIGAAIAHLGPRVRLEPIEGELPPPSYTVDTVAALDAREPGLELTLIVGADAFAQRARWRRFEALDARVRWLVVGREGTPDPEGVTIPTRFPDLSSTEIRRRIASGEPIDALVPAAVGRLIAERGLYR